LAGIGWSRGLDKILDETSFWMILGRQVDYSPKRSLSKAHPTRANEPWGSQKTSFSMSRFLSFFRITN
jgi:hypothetical protein